MTNEQIEKFLLKKHPGAQEVQISFKTRPSITGLFIKTPDYDELRVKNFWRIVVESKIAEFKQSNDLSLARIFNGMEFTRLNRS